MKIVLQRVKEARVTVEGETVGSIGAGFLLLLGVCDEDTEEVTDRMIDKVCRLRIFRDENGKTNRSLADVGGGLLVVSQFTLYADCSQGNRPSFIRAGGPQLAEKLYERALERCRSYVPETEHGVFGAEMEVSLVNDGPFTLVLDSDTLFKKK